MDDALRHTSRNRGDRPDETGVCNNHKIESSTILHASPPLVTSLDSPSQPERVMHCNKKKQRRNGGKRPLIKTLASDKSAPLSLTS